MTQRNLHFKQSVPTVYQERSVVVPKVVNPQVWQPGSLAQSVPNAIYCCQAFASTAYEWVIKFILSTQAFQYLNRSRVQRNTPCFTRFTML